MSKHCSNFGQIEEKPWVKKGKAAGWVATVQLRTINERDKQGNFQLLVKICYLSFTSYLLTTYLQMYAVHQSWTPANDRAKFDADSKYVSQHFHVVPHLFATSYLFIVIDVFNLFENISDIMKTSWKNTFWNCAHGVSHAASVRTPTVQKEGEVINSSERPTTNALSLTNKPLICL